MKTDQAFVRLARSPSFVARVRRKCDRGPGRLAEHQVRPRVVDCLAGPLTRITAIAALTALPIVRSAHDPSSYAPVLYLPVIVPTAVLCGPRLSGVIAVLGAVVYDYLFAPPLYPSTTPIPGT